MFGTWLASGDAQMLGGEYERTGKPREGVVSIWSVGNLVFEIAKRPRSQDSVPHADQWKTIASVSAIRHGSPSLGHFQPAPDVQSRSLQEYNQYCGVEISPEVVA